MAKSSDTLSRIASCADYDSDEGEEVISTRKQANIAVKRSGDSLGKDLATITLTSAGPPQHRTHDMQSDSGYSSRTQATAASADSDKSVKTSDTKSVACSDIQTVSSTTSSRKDATKKKSKTKKCTDPNCTRTHRTRNPKSTASASPVKAAARSPTRKMSPPPTKRRVPRLEPQQELRPTLRQRSQSTSSQPRPRSYHSVTPYPLVGPSHVPSPYSRSGYPAGPEAHMYVNRAVQNPMARPPLTHYNTEMSARQVNPRATYAAPLITQQKDAPRTIISARRPTKQGYVEPSDEEDDEDQDSLEDETDSDEEGPTAAEYQQFMQAQQNRKARAARAQELEDRQRAMADAQKAKHVADQMAKRVADHMAMPPPNRPQSTVNGSYSMRRPTNNATPKITYGQPSVLSNNLTFDGGELSAALRQAYPHSIRPSPSPTGTKAPSYPIAAGNPRANLTMDTVARQVRRNSMYDMDGHPDLMHGEHALMAAAEHLERQQQEALRQRRNSQATGGFNPEAIRAHLARLSLAGAGEPEDEQKIMEAQKYIERAKDHSTLQLGDGILRKIGANGETASVRSKISSKDGSSTTGHRRKQSAATTSRQSEAGFVEGEGGIKMRIDTRQDYEIEFGNQRLELRPNVEGTVDLYIGGKRPGQYHTSKASSTMDSKLVRRPSQRVKYIEDNDEEDTSSEEEDERDLRSEREIRAARKRRSEYEAREETRSTRGGAARRRAETYSTYDGEEDRRRRPSVREVSPDRRSYRPSRRRDESLEDDRSYRTSRRVGSPVDEHRRRGSVRRDVSPYDERPQRRERRDYSPVDDRRPRGHPSRVPATPEYDRRYDGRRYDDDRRHPEERRYAGAPHYDDGRSPNGNRYSQSFGRYEPSSPRPGHGGYGQPASNDYPGFGA